MRCLQCTVMSPVVHRIVCFVFWTFKKINCTIMAKNALSKATTLKFPTCSIYYVVAYFTSSHYTWYHSPEGINDTLSEMNIDSVVGSGPRLIYPA